MKSKRNSSKPLIMADENPSSTEEKGFDFFKQWEQMQNFTSQLSKRTNQMDELLKAIFSLSFAAKDKNMLKEVISSLAKLNQAQTQKNSSTNKPKEGSSTNKPKEDSTPKLSGDSLYDLFNSPAMTNIVKEVMKKKKRK